VHRFAGVRAAREEPQGRPSLGKPLPVPHERPGKTFHRGSLGILGELPAPFHELIEFPLRGPEVAKPRQVAVLDQPLRARPQHDFLVHVGQSLGLRGGRQSDHVGGMLAEFLSLLVVVFQELGELGMMTVTVMNQKVVGKKTVAPFDFDVVYGHWVCGDDFRHTGPACTACILGRRATLVCRVRFGSSWRLR